MVLDSLRSGWTERHGHIGINECKIFLNGPYPNLSKLTLIELRQLKFKIEDSYVIIQNEVADSRDSIEIFLLAQWRNHHENLVGSSTPSETSTYDKMIDYCNVKSSETDSEEELGIFLKTCRIS